MEDTSALAYLRPETAQGIFVNFKNIYQTARKRPPFGVAQIGKSFRNEITPGNFTFRLREFEQAELEYFVPDDGKDMEAFHEWVERRKAWYAQYGIESERLRFYELTDRSALTTRKPESTWSIFSHGAGASSNRSRTAAPTIWTPTRRLSGKDLQFFDEATKTHYTPLLIESSAGIDRTLLTFMIDAYERERSVDPNGKETERTVLRFHPVIAPVQVAVFSLARNKPELVERARAIEAALTAGRSARNTTKETSASSTAARTRSERRFCVTVDYETLDDGSGHGARARFDAAGARRSRWIDRLFTGEVGTMTVQDRNEVRLFLRRRRSSSSPVRAQLDEEYARRKGRRPRRDDRRRVCRCRRGSRSRPRRACAFYESGGAFPDGLQEQIDAAMRELEARTGKGFGDVENPLLVSVRSGARVSMPGMMDTILNLGLNDRNRREPREADRQRALRLGRLPPFRHDVRQRRARHRQRALRRADRRDEEVRSASRPTPRSMRPRGRALVERFKAIVRERAGREFPARRARAAHGCDRGGLRFVELQARHRLPPLQQDSRRLGHGGQRHGDGLRQHGRRLGNRRCVHAQSQHRRTRALRRVL